ncbi:hypothetical protein [Glaciecola sp. KUL10]|uniref:hypothetical protein n=1 Tax=Glaciecola sp. (strain KUL10) TaxID=2161813 RepID=UPI000D7892E2|nr:hypothetical protein [Glaciecola sp. KUL10]GBL03707.1 glutathione-dependent formaldehyde-activating protein [Glaciecola sp. KUL10]
MNYSTSCSCGKVKVVTKFPSPIEEYQARECDCDFCTLRGLAYLSDVYGTIYFSPKDTMNQLKQSSGQATFWECDNCHDVVAVTTEKNGEVRSAIGLYGLFFIVQIIALGVEDQTKFGWTWILVFITVPVGVLVGGVLGYFMSIKLQENFNSVFK